MKQQNEKNISVPKLSIEETSKFTKDLEKDYKEKMNTFNLDDIISKEIIEATKEAFKRGINANRLVINEKYSFIKPFLFGARHTPLMIAGMHTIFSTLPDKIDYVVFYSEYCDKFDNNDIVQKNKKLEKENKRLKKMIDVRKKAKNKQVKYFKDGVEITDARLYRLKTMSLKELLEAGYEVQINYSKK